jgi:acetyl-CoA acetyltransferase
MEDAVIVSAARTPVGSFGGQFRDIALGHRNDARGD